LALWLLLFLLLLYLTSVVKGAQTRWQSSVKGWGWVGLGWVVGGLGAFPNKQRAGRKIVGGELGAFPNKQRAGRKIARLHASLSKCKKCLN